MNDENDLLKKIIYYIQKKKKCKYLLKNGSKDCGDLIIIPIYKNTLN